MQSKHKNVFFSDNLILMPIVQKTIINSSFLLNHSCRKNIFMIFVMCAYGAYFQSIKTSKKLYMLINFEPSNFFR